MVTKELVLEHLKWLYGNYVESASKIGLEVASFEYWIIVNFIVPQSDSSIELMDAKNEIESLKRKVSSLTYENDGYRNKIKNFIEDFE